MKTKYLLSFLFLMSIFFAQAQDIHLTQANMTPLLVNPANAGAEYEMRGILNYRSQWKSVNAPFVTMMASYDMAFKNSNSRKKGFFAGGVYVFTDKAGTSNMKTSQANLSAAYHLNLDKKNTLGLGFQGGYFQRSSTTSNLKWGSQYDGFEYNEAISSGEGIGDNFSFGSADFNSGLVWTFRNDKNYFSGQKMLIVSGLSFQHINKPSYDYQNITTDNLYNRWIAHSEGIIGFSKQFTLLPYLFYSYQGSINEIMFGTNMLYTVKEASSYTQNVKGMAIGGGAFYRWNDAVILTLITQYANYSFEFSYDINVSTLMNASGGNGAFELSLRYVYPSPFGGVKSKSRFN